MIDIGPTLANLLRDAFWAAVWITVVIWMLGGFDRNEPN